MNQMKQFANLENKKTYVRHGKIHSYDSKLYRVKVTLPPDDFVTGWLPLATWGEIIPPKIDTQCVVIFFDGEINTGIVVGKIFSNVDQPPQDADVTQPGSFLLRTENGTVIKITNDGQIEIHAKDGQAILVNSDTHVFVGDITQDLKRLLTESVRDLYNQHKHDLAGSPPLFDYLITDDDLTDVLEAN